jgi:anthraniloyl-CoA monooxygenase
MKIVCVGGGPAGLYFATLAKLRSNDHDITVVERNSAGVTYGWGVVFSDKLLYNLYSNDFESAHEIRNGSGHCHPTKVHIQGKLARLVDSSTLSTGRRRLLDVLAKRAIDLGVDVRFEHELKDLSEFVDADLIVACDGMNSRLRHLYANYFHTNVEVGQNKYIWLGTHKVFDAFTFGFEKTGAGWIWFHAYRFNNDTSTFIVECSPQTWDGLGFDELAPDESIALLEDIFESYLDGYSLMNQMSHLGKAAWLNFRRVTNEYWQHNNIVLMGDAAHTTHFTIGSGTELALEDAISLAKKLHKPEQLTATLKAYEEERRFALRIPQIAAYNSAQWFENVHRHIDQDAEVFVSSLLNRMQPKNTRYSGFSGFSRLW